MYILDKFSEERLTRFNAIIDTYNNTQNSYINLIACVSYVFSEVLSAIQYPLSTLPTEGVINSRYFPLSSYMDDIENIAEELTLKLFNIESGFRVNIQPHSGTQANHIIYNSILSKNDKVLSLKPSDGGHISHSKIFNGNTEVIYYSLTKDNTIDYENIRLIVEQHNPKLIIAGGSSYPREINYKKIAEIASEYNTYVLADISHTALFLSGGIHENIFPYIDFATFTMEKNLRGPHGGIIIYKECFHQKICQSIFPYSQGSPIQNIMFGKAVALQLLSDIDIKSYALDVVSNARCIADVLMNNGIEVVTAGTDSHIVLVDVGRLGFSGEYIEKLMQNNCILVNRNLIPNDKKAPLVTSGIRIGSTAITNLNFSKEDVVTLSNILVSIIKRGNCNKVKLKKLINKYFSKLNTSS